MTIEKETIIRPNGKPYRPRKGMKLAGFKDDNDGSWVLVLRTHDVDKARRYAESRGMRHLDFVRRCWAKKVMRYGAPYWATDADYNGAAAVLFEEVDE